jgi:4-hydroxybenzoate polyprenyltransferase
VAIVRLVHPAPAFAVVALAGSLAAILGAQANGVAISQRAVLTTLSVLGSQILTGALNDWADRDRDRVAQPTKPIPSGLVTERDAIVLAGAGAVLQVAASLPLGALPTAIGLIASASAVAYNLWLSRTAASFAPYLVSFGLLPLWVASGVGVPLERIAAAPLLVGPFAVAAHLANAVRDFELDAGISSGNITQRLGRRASFALAWTVAMAVGIGVGVAFALAGDLDLVVVALGAAGIIAVAQGAAGADRLWAGMLVAAVCWTSAWALATG